ncbi:MAG: CPBP family intramembrane metalloprotease [Pedosphaera sp.]|nr:CPBP family intramembrane metalloprotease [Pedosphaera sp.]
MNSESETTESASPPAWPLIAPPPIISPPIPGAAPAQPAWSFWLTMAFSAAIAGAFIAVQVVVVVLLVVAYTAADRRFTVDELKSDGLLLSIATCSTAPVVVGLSVFFAWLKRGLPVKEYLGLKPITLKAAFWSFASLIGVSFLWEAVVKVFGLQEIPEFMIEAFRTAKFLPLLWLALVVAAPAAEECFFRGFLFQGLMLSRVGPVGAILITSLLWAVIHLQYGWVEIAFIFLLGLLLGVIRFKSGSVWLSFLIHAASNLIATVEMALLDY